MSGHKAWPVQLAAAVLLFVLLPGILKADTLQENFNELTPSLNATNIGAFTVTGGSVDVVGGAVFGFLCVAPESGNCVDMDGTTNQAGQISSAGLTLTPGTYLLSFDLIGSQRGFTTSTTVTLGSLYDETFLLASSDVTTGIVSQLITVNSTTVVPLVFTSNDGASDNGALLDNVDLKLVQSVPEPATISLIGAGLAGLIARRRLALKR